jgi:hypothetical protein
MIGTGSDASLVGKYSLGQSLPVNEALFSVQLKLHGHKAEDGEKRHFLVPKASILELVDKMYGEAECVPLGLLNCEFLHSKGVNDLDVMYSKEIQMDQEAKKRSLKQALKATTETLAGTGAEISDSCTSSLDGYDSDGSMDSEIEAINEARKRLGQ